MYINGVVSFLGAWQLLQNDYEAILEEVQQVLTDIDPSELISGANIQRYHGKKVVRYFHLPPTVRSSLNALGWDDEVIISYGKSNRLKLFMQFIKNNVVMDIALGTLQIMQSALFVEYPLLIQTGKIKLVVIIMFSREFSDFPASCPFERIRDILVEFTPITLKYPFAILGISNSPSELRVDELTSAMDQYLIGSIGMTLDEMRLLGERPRFEFKAVFPHENSRKFFHPVTAFANQRGGGVILIGIDDTTGNIIGVPKGKPLDDLQLAIKDCIRNNCMYY